jgi:hypothetical protein
MLAALAEATHPVEIGQAGAVRFFPREIAGSVGKAIDKDGFSTTANLGNGRASQLLGHSQMMGLASVTVSVSVIMLVSYS